MYRRRTLEYGSTCTMRSKRYCGSGFRGGEGGFTGCNWTEKIRVQVLLHVGIFNSGTLRRRPSPGYVRESVGKGKPGFFFFSISSFFFFIIILARFGKRDIQRRHVYNITLQDETAVGARSPMSL